MNYTYHYLYKITNKINGKYYYGVHNTNNLEDGYMGSGYKLIRAQNKYGMDNFEKQIIEFFDTSEQAFSKEAEVVNEDMLRDKNCYNIVLGGRGGDPGEEIRKQNSTKIKKWHASLSPEERKIRSEKISKSVKKFNQDNEEFIQDVHKRSIETNRNMSPERKSMKNKKISESLRKNYESKTEDEIKSKIDKYKNTMSNKSPEEKEISRRKRSKSGIIGKANMSTDAKRKSVEKRKETISNWSEEKKQEHSRKMKNIIYRYDFLTETGEIRIMDKSNAKRYHPNWILIGPTKDS